MRELLFRGKRVDNGEWVSSGNIIHFNEDNQHFIPTMNGRCTSTRDINDNVIAMENAVFYKVIPETVGQYTGLKDKNGKRIFEGDIVKAQFVINQSKQRFKVIFEQGSFLFDNSYIKANVRDIFSLEVFGNIHDNPEAERERTMTQIDESEGFKTDKEKLDDYKRRAYMYWDMYISRSETPLGLKPRFIHLEQRRDEILRAMQRYARANKTIPLTWVDEVKEIIIALDKEGVDGNTTSQK